jgi:hypothetical protein
MPLIIFFDFYGSIFYAALSSAFVIFVSLFQIRKTLKIRYKKTWRLLLLMMVGLGAFTLISHLFGLVIPDPTQYPRLVMLIILGIGTLTTMGAYFLTTYWLQVPQAIFGENFADNMLKRFKR